MSEAPPTPMPAFTDGTTTRSARAIAGTASTAAPAHLTVSAYARARRPPLTPADGVSEPRLVASQSQPHVADPYARSRVRCEACDRRGERGRLLERRIVSAVANRLEGN